MCRPHRLHFGFTLIELLVSIAIIAILLSILIGSFAYARNLARDAVCRSQLNQIAKCFHQYADDNRGSVPDELSPISWDEQMLKYIPDRSIYRCPADRSDFANMTGLSYGWRDSINAFRGERGSLSRRRLDSISPNTLIMLFDDLPNRHKFNYYNIAQVSTAVKQYDVFEFYEDMSQPVK